MGFNSNETLLKDQTVGNLREAGVAGTGYLPTWQIRIPGNTQDTHLPFTYTLAF